MANDQPPVVIGQVEDQLQQAGSTEAFLASLTPEAKVEVLFGIAISYQADPWTVPDAWVDVLAYGIAEDSDINQLKAELGASTIKRADERALMVALLGPEILLTAGLKAGDTRLVDTRPGMWRPRRDRTGNIAVAKNGPNQGSVLDVDVGPTTGETIVSGTKQAAISALLVGGGLALKSGAMLNILRHAATVSAKAPKSLQLTAKVLGLGVSGYVVGTGAPLTIAEWIQNSIDPEGQEQADLQAEFEAAQRAGTIPTLPSYNQPPPSGFDPFTGVPLAAGYMPTSDAGGYMRMSRPRAVARATGSTVPSAYSQIEAPPNVSGFPTAYEDDPYLGLEESPEGYDTKVARTGARTELGGDQFFQGPIMAIPEYKHSDVARVLNMMTPAQLASFEARAIEAGLIDPNSKYEGTAYIPGLRGPGTKQYNALAVVMRETNLTQSPNWHWSDMLDELVRRQQALEKPEDIRVFSRGIYQTPDPATFRERARDAVQAELGRTVNDWEMNLLVAQQSRDHRAGFDALESARYDEWLLQGRALEGDLTAQQEIAQGGGRATGVIPDVDARFDERFRKMFENELARADRTQYVERSTGNLMAGLGRAARMMGS